MVIAYSRGTLFNSSVPRVGAYSRGRLIEGALNRDITLFLQISILYHKIRLCVRVCVCVSVCSK